MTACWVGLVLGFVFAGSGAAAVPEELLRGGWEEFKKSEAGQRKIDPEDLDTNLVAVAILHATNQQRQEQKLAPLQYHEGARKAAALQARIMQERGSISHVNPDQPNLRTLEDRVKAAGLKYQFIAENVATAFGIKYEAGKPFYPRTENGQEVFSYEPRGEPIPPHSYASFAEALVENWMSSPGHRKNILNEAAEFLGASCFPKTDETGMTKFYCAQVFFTPR